MPNTYSKVFETMRICRTIDWSPRVISSRDIFKIHTKCPQGSHAIRMYEITKDPRVVSAEIIYTHMLALLSLTHDPIK